MLLTKSYFIKDIAEARYIKDIKFLLNDLTLGTSHFDLLLRILLQIYDLGQCLAWKGLTHITVKLEMLKWTQIGS